MILEPDDFFVVTRTIVLCTKTSMKNSEQMRNKYSVLLR